jgi:hypothetical protein
MNAEQKLLRAELPRREEAIDARAAAEPSKFYGRCVACESWGRMPAKDAAVCLACMGTAHYRSKE